MPTKPLKPAKQVASRKAKSKSASRVANLTESEAGVAWMGIQMHDHLSLLNQYTVAFGCCLIIAGYQQDEQVIAIKIKAALDKGEKVGGIVQEFQEALFISWKAGELWREVSSHLEHSSGPLIPIAIWAGMQRDDRVRSAFSSAEGKLLQEILIIACMPRDMKQLGKVGSAVDSAMGVLSKGISSSSTPSVSGGCALPTFVISLLIVVGLASVFT